MSRSDDVVQCECHGQAFARKRLHAVGESPVHICRRCALCVALRFPARRPAIKITSAGEVIAAKFGESRVLALSGRAHISPTRGAHPGQFMSSRSAAVTSVLAALRQLPPSSGHATFDYGSIGRGFKSLRAHNCDVSGHRGHLNPRKRGLRCFLLCVGNAVSGRVCIPRGQFRGCRSRPRGRFSRGLRPSGAML